MNLNLLIPELGNLCLIIGLVLALTQAVLPLYGFLAKNDFYLNLAKPSAYAQFIFILLSFGILTYGFITNDFSVKYIAEHSNSMLPVYYRIAGVWGGHEGSLLLWALLLSGWTVAVCLFSKTLPKETRALVISVMGFISIGFLLFLIATSNPFIRLLPNIPANGKDLNPLLQDIGLIIHPPMLYMGYVGFAVAFAFALAALISGKCDSTWARWARPWTLIAWVFLTAGITLGSWWAYRELGWGGWWFWDPVENASLLPWLVGTALLHSLAATEKRKVFKAWTVLLAITAFSLCLMGTFLVRSGVLTSVHAFAVDPTRGIFILLFLGITVGVSLILFAFRGASIQAENTIKGFSREGFILINNILLITATATILLGTLYPLILDALGQGKLSVGAPYFNKVFIPIMTPLCFLMALAPWVNWKEYKIKKNLKIFSINFLASLILAIALPYYFFNKINFLVILGLFISFWIIFTTLGHILKYKNPRKLSKSYYGMVLAHLGIAICIIGITLTSNYSIERDVKLSVGEKVAVGNYEFTFIGLKDKKGPNYVSTHGYFLVDYKNKFVTQLVGEKRIYTASGMPMTDAGIKTNLFRDLYVALGEPISKNTWAVRLYVKPFIWWIWFGGVFMSLGGLLSVFDRRYRKNKLKKQINLNLESEPA